MTADSAPRVTIFGPHPILGTTIERRGEDRDEIHVHPGGQGVWVARMAAELGAYPVLCCFNGGETGRVLASLLEEYSGATRYVETAAPSGAWVIDRRSGEREMVAVCWSDLPSRHEVDDLFSLTTAAALESEVLVVCGPLPSDALPLDLYENLVADARAGGTKVVVDLGSPKLDHALKGRPDVVKVDDWQLAEFVSGPVDEPEQFRAAAEQVLERGAQAVIATRGAQPALVLRDESVWTLTPPQFDEGAAEGSGDSMVGALAAGLARGLDWEDMLKLGAAAGATNFLRHGLGTGSREVVERLLGHVELRRLEGAL